jgi:hypothetical protein
VVLKYSCGIVHSTNIELGWVFGFGSQFVYVQLSCGIIVSFCTHNARCPFLLICFFSLNHVCTRILRLACLIQRFRRTQSAN